MRKHPYRVPLFIRQVNGEIVRVEFPPEYEKLWATYGYPPSLLKARVRLSERLRAYSAVRVLSVVELEDISRDTPHC